MTQIKSTVIIDWQLSSYFGWGINGVQSMLNWSLQQKELLLTCWPVDESAIDLNALEWAQIRPALERSRAFHARLEPFRGQRVTVDLPVLHAVGNDFYRSDSLGFTLFGRPSIALPVFESTLFSPEVRERAKPYALSVAVSNWNLTMLERAGIGPTALAPEGIDPTAFHPAPKSGWLAGRFAVFSGGKVEYRKGQDLVLKAFRVFAQRHPDALLVTAWASPWPGLARTMNADPTLCPVPFRPDGTLDLRAWAADNGIAPDQFIDLGIVPNSALPRLYREMDVGLFPNRCEGGTNLVAMECMACGVPIILSANTGHLDLIDPDRCFPLERQSPVEGADHVGWGESDVEEIVETLEAVRQDRSASLARGKRGAQFMSTRTWADTVRRRAKVIAAYL